MVPSTGGLGLLVNCTLSAVLSVAMGLGCKKASKVDCKIPEHAQVIDLKQWETNARLCVTDGQHKPL